MFFLYALSKVQIYFFSGFITDKIIAFRKVEGIIYADKLIIVVLAVWKDISSRVSAMVIIIIKKNQWLSWVIV